MHDLLLAQEVLDAVRAYTKKHKLNSVSQVKIALGKIADCHCDLNSASHFHSEHFSQEITPANLKYNFNLIKKGTIAKKAMLKVISSSEAGWRLEEIYGSRNKKTTR